ncbi:neutral zinc metallopeptidase [Mucilaginibacter sp. Bleaf8]|uniref:KPN_02809 family neutral zinc metallopeptidase n=1 Tax=Mucilaginibacter sp. Bleaf8 TaxID=2834430 RepID=UPI001BCCEEE3|nr:neutral zinc metallopeptidase [Mucilaginibacter sp. Bleaf8]MBS7565853.1 neutral zinc metallopeptidase [Mucilaginibacter sp. Bleaf8]
MKWIGGRESDNVEEGSGGGGGRMAMGGGVVGIIGLLIYMFTGVNPSQILGGGGGGDAQTEQQNRKITRPKTDQEKFASVVFGYTEDVWGKVFQDMGQKYDEPVLHFFSGEVGTDGCGFAASSTGPFYCPGDSKVYIDLSFFDQLQNEFGASGDFARAYVIAHEVGHHVQNLLGTSAKMEQARRQLSETQYNKLSVKLELQADFYAGVWAHYVQQRGLLDPGDIEEALNAASAVGDDRLTQGRVSPDSFTHGTSEQRMYWFKKGYETGDIKLGNTFADSSL